MKHAITIINNRYHQIYGNNCNIGFYKRGGIFVRNIADRKKPKKKVDQ